MDNDYFQLNVNDLKKNDGIIVAKLEAEKWIVEIQGQKLEFALADYPFQKSYICAYFIRQLLYYEMNEKQKSLRYLFKIFQKPIHKLQKKELPEVAIDFHENGIAKKLYIVKNFKPLHTAFRRWITQAPYIWATGSRSYGRILGKRIKKINEQKYWDESSVKVRILRLKIEQEKNQQNKS